MQWQFSGAIPKRHPPTQKDRPRQGHTGGVEGKVDQVVNRDHRQCEGQLGPLMPQITSEPPQRDGRQHQRDQCADYQGIEIWNSPEERL